jgi:two-component system, OmpR family, KDP operon response regulator KdpE
MMFRRKIAPAAATPVSTPLMALPDSMEAEAYAPRKKILVVDDDPFTLEALSHKLTSRGFNVVTAKDGSQALHATRREKPDLMLLDVNLPPDVGGVDWNAFLIMDWLKRMNEAPNVPVIVMSASDRDEYKTRAYEAGAAAFFCKMMDNDQMLASIDRALTGKHESKPAAFEI